MQTAATEPYAKLSKYFNCLHELCVTAAPTAHSVDKQAESAGRTTITSSY